MKVKLQKVSIFENNDVTYKPAWQKYKVFHWWCKSAPGIHGSSMWNAETV